MSVAEDDTVWCAVGDHARFEYWRNAAETAAAWRGDRFTVGDLGRLDRDGYLFLEGRRTDLIISGGINVRPTEVEAVLAECPGVDEIAVYGRDDDEWGERVCAAVVGQATDDAIDRHAREHLAPHKRPKEIVHVDELPRTATGKILRRVLH